MGSAASGDAIRNISQIGSTFGQRTVTAAMKKMTDEFGSLTFNDEAQRARLPKDVYRALRRADRAGGAARPVGRRHRRQRAEGLGGRARRHALHALVPADDRHHRREARFVSLADARMAARSPSSAARNWSGASPTPRASRRAACARPSRRAATPRGTRPARRGCW